VNQGHCHQRIKNVMLEQVERMTLCSRAFYNENLGIASEFMCRTFN